MDHDVEPLEFRLHVVGFGDVEEFTVECRLFQVYERDDLVFVAERAEDDPPDGTSGSSDRDSCHWPDKRGRTVCVHGWQTPRTSWWSHPSEPEGRPLISESG